MKAASYEINAGGLFVRWDEEGKHIQDLSVDREIILPANSITFVQLESKLRLPDYIAVRFNLRIQHVHRGLLLGTGPLVDPGFKGNLLVPLHNLTAAPYTIQKNEGLIWVEFTKTSHVTPDDVSVSCPNESFDPTSDKTDQKIEYYFEKASRNRPIQSSIPGQIEVATQIATQAKEEAIAAKRTNQIFASIGFLGVLSTVVGLLSFLHTSSTRIENNSASVNKATVEVQDVRDKVKELEATLKAQSAHSNSDPDDGRQIDGHRLQEVEARLSKLEAGKVSIALTTRRQALVKTPQRHVRPRP